MSPVPHSVSASTRWPTPVPLAVIKADKALQSWELVRISRLSVMPVTPAQWKRVEELARGAGREAAG